MMTTQPEALRTIRRLGRLLPPAANWEVGFGVIEHGQGAGLRAGAGEQDGDGEAARGGGHLGLCVYSPRC